MHLNEALVCPNVWDRGANQAAFLVSRCKAEVSGISHRGPLSVLVFHFPLPYGADRVSRQSEIQLLSPSDSICREG